MTCIVVFSLQQWLREHARMLLYAYVSYIVSTWFLLFSSTIRVCVLRVCENRGSDCNCMAREITSEVWEVNYVECLANKIRPRSSGAHLTPQLMGTGSSFPRVKAAMV